MKIIFLTGGVYSSLGKGVILSSIGKVLQFEGYKCNVLKFDPYLNYNSKFLSPLQHGEVFVTKDGEETDLDLGHYERFLGIELDSHSCYTTGKIFQRLLDKERRGEYDGKTVQVAPHLVNEILLTLEHFRESGTEILLIELGGTVFDLEQKPFILAASQMKKRKGDELTFVHLAPLLHLSHNNEKKTKPIQHSLALLAQLGIVPDLLILKGDKEISEAELSKISFNFPAIPEENILSAPYLLDIYEIPLQLYQTEKLFEKISPILKLDSVSRDVEKGKQYLKEWIDFNEQIKAPKKYQLRVAIVGKYSNSPESYYSIIQSLKFAGYKLSAELSIELIQSAELTSEEQLEGFQAICVPPGFGNKSLNGIFLAIKYAREKKIPFLGICFGMQLAVIEYFRNVLGLEADSVELNPNTSCPIFTSWSEKQEMRLGNRTITFDPASKIAQIYEISEKVTRHRNKYVLNLELAKEKLASDSELIFSASEGEIVEAIELKNHPFFIGVQYHPEFNSRPNDPEKLFLALIEKTIEQNY
ncbi:CTP synthetase [Mycoplasma wenyonii str. Massachusetts]|uniref:CTP synthase (glutamine hydrolyzing) n=1 Tax=Mycoplasma wenyonii (strain Massachusetts) TaxID=1197325 RepID=I6ZEE8_MYCWM|nr:CTP synthase [Mycoplasma wenyonii]AFN64962.1 CTP synthetase [Mycoplasma wenyonii str. Massachusetts]